jgi:hypothetical protein
MAGAARVSGMQKTPGPRRGLLGPGGLLNDLTLLKSTYLGINKC